MLCVTDAYWVLLPGAGHRSSLQGLKFKAVVRDVSNRCDEAARSHFHVRQVTTAAGVVGLGWALLSFCRVSAALARDKTIKVA